MLIDALTLDFKAKNVDSFAEHLWHLYHNLGQSGRQVKERMLGLGYTLGEHPVFESLEAQPTDAAALREIGIQHGFLDLGASQKKHAIVIWSLKLLIWIQRRKHLQNAL